MNAGLCRHVYTERVCGVAGLFTPRQLDRLLNCLPPDSIEFIEQDFEVWFALESDSSMANIAHTLHWTHNHKVQCIALNVLCLVRRVF